MEAGHVLAVLPEGLADEVQTSAVAIAELCPLNPRRRRRPAPPRRGSASGSAAQPFLKMDNAAGKSSRNTSACDQLNRAAILSRSASAGAEKRRGLPGVTAGSLAIVPQSIQVGERQVQLGHRGSGRCQVGLALIQVAHFQSEPAEQGVGFQRIRIAGHKCCKWS